MLLSIVSFCFYNKSNSRLVVTGKKAQLKKKQTARHCTEEIHLKAKVLKVTSEATNGPGGRLNRRRRKNKLQQLLSISLEIHPEGKQTALKVSKKYGSFRLS